jgi:hypothetical protein
VAKIPNNIKLNPTKFPRSVLVEPEELMNGGIVALVYRIVVVPFVVVFAPGVGPAVQEDIL